MVVPRDVVGERSGDEAIRYNHLVALPATGESASAVVKYGCAQAFCDAQRKPVRRAAVVSFPLS